MTVTELLQGVQSEVDGREVVDFYKTLNQQVRSLARKRRWHWLQSEYGFDTVENYTTGTVSLTAGSDVVTGAGTVWTSAMAGRKLFVDGYAAVTEIESVTGADTLVLESAWPYEDVAGKAYGIFQDEYALPSDFEQLIDVRDVKNNVNLLAVTGQQGHAGRTGLRGVAPFYAAEYSVWRGNTVRLYGVPLTGGRMSVYYYRRPVGVSGPNDEIDLPEYLHDLLDLRLRRLYLLRFAGENQTYVQRAAALEQQYREEFRTAAALDSMQSPVMVRNERTNF